MYDDAQNKFVKHQTISTVAAQDWEPFEMNGQHYLVVANSKSQSSYFYRYDSTTELFEKNPTAFPTSANGPKDWEAFRMNGKQYLVVADYGQGVHSHIYVYDAAGGGDFKVFQTMNIRRPMNWKSFVIDGIQFLAVSNPKSLLQ